MKMTDKKATKLVLSGYQKQSDPQREKEAAGGKAILMELLKATGRNEGEVDQFLVKFGL